jgi:DNA helicase-2/ATP-dependent DNA helicase PcrA
MEFSLENLRAPDSVPPIDFRAELNDEQFAAVTARARPGP